jgi:Transposase
LCLFKTDVRKQVSTLKKTRNSVKYLHSKKDLEERCPVDLLADREAGSVARWLREHPGVKLLSRDRAGMYAEGAKRGAPRAKQIADRYHLLVNLRDTLKDALARFQDVLPTAATDQSRQPLRTLPADPGALASNCFARASCAELDPRSTQTAHEPLFP